eukprot:GEMP01030754.1.p1 GENE.GEMP01030754.1~~GEMP01030754.1.p1  ORF type:complete len:449 (+),score=124.18 GEMP01030754.1:71-1417(+)
MASSFRRALRGKTVARDALELWSSQAGSVSQQRLSYAEHVETLYHIGKLVEGRTRGSVKRTAMERADRKQKDLPRDPTFCALLDRIGTLHDGTASASASSSDDSAPEAKVLSMALLAISSTHEDLAMSQTTMVDAQREWFLGVINRLVGAFAHSMQEDARDMSTRCVANCLHALNRLHIYDREFFSRASQFLANKLLTIEENPPEHSWMHMQQWLHASVDLNHPWTPEHYARLISLRWSVDDEATQRLFQLCLNVCCIGGVGGKGDPLMERLICEINRRARTKKSVIVAYEKMSSSMLHAAQHSRILIHNEELSAVRFAPEVESALDTQIAEPGRAVTISSRFESEVGRALQQVNVQILKRDALIQPYGLSADFHCVDLENNVQFYCEIDGPSHFLVVPPRLPRGRLILKERLFRALGLRLLSVPYWMDIRRELGSAVAAVTRKENLA